MVEAPIEAGGFRPSPSAATDGASAFHTPCGLIRARLTGPSGKTKNEPGGQPETGKVSRVEPCHGFDGQPETG